jgi:uncharacterized membrane protein
MAHILMRNALKKYADLIIVAVISLLLIPAVSIIPTDIPRIILGVPFVLFIPGYALVAALFPVRGSLSTAERLAYSLALSFALVALIGLLLNYVWEISLYPMLICLESFTLSMCLIAWLRRRSSYEEPVAQGASWLSKWQALAGIDRALYVTLALVIIAAGGVAVYTYNKNIQPISEMYLLGSQGKAADYPQELKIGEKAVVTLVVVNQERKPTTYTVRLGGYSVRAWVEGQETDNIVLTLEDGGQRSYRVEFIFDKPGPGQKLDFNLFRAGDTEAYLNVYLKIAVSN